MIALATCSYSEYRPDMGAPVRASLGTPKWFSYPLPASWLNAAPDGWMLNVDYDKYRRAYFSKLDKIGIDRLRGDLEHIADAYTALNGTRPDRLVILCYEGLRNPQKWCHRTMFAEWWEAQTGEHVPELGATCPAPAPQPPTLF